MSKIARITLLAVLLLAVLFSLPFWLPNALAAVRATSAPAAQPAAAQAEVPALQEPAAPAAQPSPLLAAATEPIFVWDGGRYIGSTTQTLDAPPQVLAWVPASGQPLWVRETGFSYGGLYDAASGRIYLMEQRNADSQSLEGVEIPNTGIYPSEQWPLFLTVLDAASGEMLSATHVTGRFFNSPTSGAARPLALRGSTLFMMNYSASNNLAAYDLETKTLPDEKWDVCETGYPSKVEVSAELDAVVSLCIDYSTSDMKGSLTRLSLADGSASSLDLGLLGNEQYMGGNGLALGNDGLAYVIDSDATVIVEIDLRTMQVLRQANYAEGASARQPSWLERASAWLLRQAATPAAAKRMFAATAVSPDGRTLAVSGATLESYSTRSVYLIDLASLQSARKLETGGTPAALVFPSNELLLAFYERGSYSNPLGGMVFDLAAGEQDTLSLQINGYLNEIIATN
jgi:hypothetical protein